MGRDSILLDRGTERLVAFAEKRTVDGRGNSVVVADLESFHVRMVTVATGDQSTAKLSAGDVAVKILRVATRPIPDVGPNSIFWIRGEFWDLGTPEKTSAQTRALRHQEYILRSRNQVAQDPTLSTEGATT